MSSGHWPPKREGSLPSVELMRIQLPPEASTDDFVEGYARYYGSDSKKEDDYTPATMASFSSAQLHHLHAPQPLPPTYKPSVSTLFCLSSRKELLTLTLPGVIISCGSSLLQPYLTMVLGRAFDSFSTFIAARTAAGDNAELLQAAKTHFKHQQLVIFVTLLILAALTVISSAVSLMFWNMNAEFIVRRLRRRVYSEVTKKKLEWFDKGMGLTQEEAGQETEGEGSSAGLAGRFARWEL